MRAIAVSQTTFRKWVALLALLIFGSLAYWVPAHADPRTGVPTKQTPAPQVAPAPPVKKDPPARSRTPVPKSAVPSTVVCRWVEAPDVTTVTPPQSFYIQGHTVDPSCGPTIQIRDIYVTVPGSKTVEEGSTFLCGPLQ
jgi:hypothetical protein